MDIRQQQREASQQPAAHCRFTQGDGYETKLRKSFERFRSAATKGHCSPADGHETKLRKAFEHIRDRIRARRTRGRRSFLQPAEGESEIQRTARLAQNDLEELLGAIELIMEHGPMHEHQEDTMVGLCFVAEPLERRLACLSELVREHEGK